MLSSSPRPRGRSQKRIEGRESHHYSLLPHTVLEDLKRELKVGEMFNVVLVTVVMMTRRSQKRIEGAKPSPPAPPAKPAAKISKEN